MFQGHGNTSKRPMPASNTDSEWLIWLAVAQIVTWLLVAAGWFVSNRSNDTRERRKEIRSAIDGIGKQLDRLTELAVTYYTACHNDPAALEAGVQLRIMQDRLFRQIPTITEEELNADVSHHLNRLMESLTGGDFESSKRQARKPNDPVLLIIGRDAESLRGAIEDAFVKHYSK